MLSGAYAYGVPCPDSDTHTACFEYFVGSQVLDTIIHLLLSSEAAKP